MSKRTMKLLYAKRGLSVKRAWSVGQVLAEMRAPTSKIGLEIAKRASGEVIDDSGRINVVSQHDVSKVGLRPLRVAV